METWIWIKGISYDDIMELYIEMQTTAWFTFPMTIGAASMKFGTALTICTKIQEENC